MRRVRAVLQLRVCGPAVLARRGWFGCFSLVLLGCGDRTTYTEVWVAPHGDVCATDEDGLLHCWGEVAEGAPTGVRTVDFDMLERAACMIPADGSPSCWTWEDEAVDVAWLEVPDGEFVEVALVTEGSTCWLSIGGDVVCAGSNEWGQLDAPAVSLAHIEGGGGSVCGLDGEGVAHCWGKDEEGALAGFTGHTFEKIDVAGSPCGITVEGDVECWGVPADWGEEDPWIRSGPFVDVSANYALCAVRSDGELDCHYFDRDGCEPDGRYLSVDLRSEFGCATVQPRGIECWGMGETASGEYECYLVHPSELASHLR